MIRTLILLVIFQLVLIKTYAQAENGAAGVQEISAGVPDKFTPYGFCPEPPMKAALEKLPVGKLPFNIADIKITINNRGVVVEVPLADSEQLYGFGLQFGSFNQRGLKIRPVVNDNPLNDAGYTHGPAAFYVSNKGYGPVEHVAANTTFEITCFVYGNNKTAATLFEDDGITFNYENRSYNIVSLLWENGKGTIKRAGRFKNTRYMIKKWQLIN